MLALGPEQILLTEANCGVNKSIIVDRRGAPLDLEVVSTNMHDLKFFDSTLAVFKYYDRATIKIIAVDSAYDFKYLRNVYSEV